MAKKNNKRKSETKPAAPASPPTLTVELVATVAASLVDHPSPENCTTYEDCDRVVELALRLIERSAYAVEGEDSPNATAAKNAYNRLWSVKGKERKLALEREEADRFTEETVRLAEEMARLLNGQTYRNRMIALKLVPKGATKSDVDQWEEEIFGSSPSEDDPFWKVFQRLKGDAPAGSKRQRADFVPLLDIGCLYNLRNYVDFIISHQKKELSEKRKASGKKLAKDPEAKKKRTPEK